MTRNVTITAKKLVNSPSKSNRHKGCRRGMTTVSGRLLAAARGVLVVVLLLGLSLSASCDFNRKTSISFKAVNHNGWAKLQSFSFEPEWPDTTTVRHYNLSVAVRHTGDYRYRNLALVVDLIDTTATGIKRVDRRYVNFSLADRHGNWLGSGFGDLYQSSVVVAQNVNRHKVHRVIVWQGMKNVETLSGVTDIGILITLN